MTNDIDEDEFFKILKNKNLAKQWSKEDEIWEKYKTKRDKND